MQAGLDGVWPYVDELFGTDELEQSLVADGVAVDASALRAGWDGYVDGVLAEATLTRPEGTAHPARRRPARHPHRADGLPARRDAAPAPRPPGCVVVSTTVVPRRGAGGCRAVLDPELPVLSIADLGILRDVAMADDGSVVVTITPTYSGCPAMDVIRRDVEDAVRAAGFDRVEVRTVLSPAWTTDWLTESGRQALQDYGIAPPSRRTTSTGPVALSLSVRCPQCGSPDTRESSRFGSTACKSLWVCNACREPFDHMKAI